jgi:hypothetical protein
MKKIGVPPTTVLTGIIVPMARELTGLKIGLGGWSTRAPAVPPHQKRNAVRAVVDNLKARPYTGTIKIIKIHHLAQECPNTTLQECEKNSIYKAQPVQNKCPTPASEPTTQSATDVRMPPEAAT